jgi:hypothetical protein
MFLEKPKYRDLLIALVFSVTRTDTAARAAVVELGDDLAWSTALEFFIGFVIYLNFRVKSSCQDQHRQQSEQK